MREAPRSVNITASSGPQQHQTVLADGMARIRFDATHRIAKGSHASSNATLCFLRFRAAFRESHSKVRDMLGIYGILRASAYRPSLPAAEPDRSAGEARATP